MSSQSSDGGSNDISSNTLSSLKRASGDIGWKYGFLADVTNKDKVQCKLCNKIVSGGINRLKKHIAGVSGNVVPCKESSDEDKKVVKEALNAKAIKLEEQRREVRAREVRAQVNIRPYDDEDNGEKNCVTIGSKRQKLTTINTMENYVRKIDPGSSLNVREANKQQSTDDDNATEEERIQAVHFSIAEWVYESGIPLDAIKSESFAEFIEAVGQYGPNWQPPSEDDLSGVLLENEVAATKELIREQEKEWKLNGCSIMIDTWTVQNKRIIMNLCVSGRKGTSFLSFKEASVVPHTGECIFEYIDACIEQTGSANVVQVVTNNASNNMKAANLLKEKRPHIFWSSCAAHTLNLMLETISKTNKFKGIIEKAKAFTIFVYSHHEILELMSKWTSEEDIVKPGVTRFATSFLTLQSLMEKKEKLRFMVSSDAWEECDHSNTEKGKIVYSTIVSNDFWKGVSYCLKVFAPLVNVFRMVDSDLKPSMAFVYGELKQAKTQIKKACNNVEANYLPILEIVDSISKGRLDTPLHLTAYLLNPYYFYNDPTLHDDMALSEALIACVKMFFHGDEEKQASVVNKEVLKYKAKEDLFGKKVAFLGCSKKEFDPVEWWSFYGNSTPNLRWMAKRILALTSKSSGFEKNGSTFDAFHMKKVNKLDAKKFNDLLYVQFNSKIISKRNRMKKTNVDTLLASDDSNAYGWITDSDDDDDEIESGLT